MHTVSVRPGTVIQQRYRIEHRAGSGGMASVYHAVDLECGGAVAIKFAHRDHRHDSRLLREAHMLARQLSSLEHPNLVRYIAHDTTVDGVPYLVVEWLEGCDLHARLRKAALSETDTITIGRQLCSALAAAHRCGIVHRDIKPSNVFLLGGDIGRVKLIDFGLGFATQTIVTGAAATLTQSGALIGTPGFIAPEQVEAASAVDGRADLYGVGALLYACLTQESPFSGAHYLAVLGKLATAPAPRVRTLRPDVSLALDALIARLLSKRPDERPATAEVLAMELEAASAAMTHATADGADGEIAVSSGEQRVMTVLLRGPDEPSSLGESVSARGTRQQSLTDASTAMLEREGATVLSLIDGSMLGLFAPDSDRAGGPDAMAARAARSALALRAHGVRAPIAVATGQVHLRGSRPVGAVIDRAVSMLFADHVRSLSGHGAGAPTTVSGVASADVETMMSRLGHDITVDEATARLIDGRFRLLGRESPYRLGSESAWPGSDGTLATEDDDSLFIGRQRELATLEGLYRECVQDALPRAVLVTGVAGMGKSRLARQFTDNLETTAGVDEAVAIWWAIGDAMRADSPLNLLAQLVGRALGLSPSGPLSERRRTLRRRVEASLHFVERAEQSEQPERNDTASIIASIDRISVFLGEIIETPFSDHDRPWLRAARRDARLMHDQMRRAWEDWLEAESARAPLVLVVDNAHGSDVASLRFIDSALHHLADRPVFVLALAQPHGEDLIGNAWMGRELDRLALRPLSQQASEALVRTLLADGATCGERAPNAGDAGDTGAANDAIRRLADRGGGNPLFLEELVRYRQRLVARLPAAQAAAEEAKATTRAAEAAIDAAVNTTVDTTANATTNAAIDAAIPETVMALVGIGLGALKTEERRVLRAASVFGRHFCVDGVAQLLGDGGERHGAVSNGLGDAVGKPASDGAAEAQVPGYAGGTGHERPRATATILESLAAAGWVHPQRRSRFAGQYEYRFRHDLIREAAYALLPAEDRVRAHRDAGTWLASAGEADARLLAEHYRRGHAPGQAQHWYLRACEQALEADDLPKAIECGERGVACGAKGHDLGMLRLMQAEAYNWQGALEDAYRCAAEAMAALLPGQAPWAHAAHQLSWATASLGNVAVVRATARLVLSTQWAPEARDAYLITIARMATHVAVGPLADTDECRALVSRLDAETGVQSPELLAVGCHLHAVLAAHEGLMGRAATLFTRAIDHWRTIGNQRQACLDQINLGICLRELGCYREGLDVFEATLPIVRRIGLMSTLPMEVELALTLARMDSASPTTRSRIRELMAQPKTTTACYAPHYDSYRAWIELECGDPAAALRITESELALAKADDDSVRPDALAPIIRARALLLQGRASEALHGARAAHAAATSDQSMVISTSLLELTHAEALYRTGAKDEACAVIAAAAAQIEARAAEIEDPHWRSCFLNNIWEHRQILAYAREWA